MAASILLPVVGPLSTSTNVIPTVLSALLTLYTFAACATTERTCMVFYSLINPVLHVTLGLYPPGCGENMLDRKSGVKG